MRTTAMMGEVVGMAAAAATKADNQIYPFDKPH